MGGLFTLIALVLAAIAYNRVGRLEKRMDDLVKNGVVSSAVSGAQAASSERPVASEGMPVSETVPSTVSPPPSPLMPREPGILEQFFQWCAVDWPMKLGAFLLFLAVGWIVTVVFWDAIGPYGQVTLGLVLGVLILFFGSRRIEQSMSQGSVLLALGAGVVYFTIFAARYEYNFFTPVSALLFMFLVTVFVGFVSVTRNSFSLALLGLFLGGLAPLLTHSGHVDITGLFSYLFILLIGTLWVTRLTGWRNLTVAGLVLYGLYSLPFMWSHFYIVDPDQPTKVLIAVVFATLFFIANVLSIIYDRMAKQSDLALGLMNGLILLGWIGSVVPPEWRSMAAVLAAIVASVGAYMIHLMTGLRQPVYIHSAVAGVFIGMATAYELSGSLLVIAYTLEVIALVVGSKLILRSDEAAKGASVLAIIPFILSIESLDRYSSSMEVFTKDFFAIVLVIGMAWIFSKILHKDESSTGTDVSPVFLGVAMAYTLVFIWPFTRVLFGDRDTSTTVSLLIYTVIGMYSYVTGKFTERKNTQRLGSGLLLFVTGHLLLLDVWSMDVSERILTFAVIGVLFMSTTFIRKRT